MSLFGSFVETSNQPRFIYERGDDTSKMASVNHVVSDPVAAALFMRNDNKKHTEYISLGRYLGPDTPAFFDALKRRAAKSKSKFSKDKEPTTKASKGRGLPKAVRR